MWKCGNVRKPACRQAGVEMARPIFTFFTFITFPHFHIFSLELVLPHHTLYWFIRLVGIF